jgi:hypothetical protein
VIAFEAIERALFESCGTRRDLRKHHPRLAFRTAEALNCEQWDCGWVIGHRIVAKEGTVPNMRPEFRSRCSILLIHENFAD